MRQRRRALTGPAGAAAYGLDGFRDEPWAPTWCAPNGARPEAGVLQTRHWEEPTVVEGVPLAPVGLVLRHCGGLIERGGITPVDRLELATEHALREGHLTEAQLRRMVGGGGAAPGDALLRQVLARRPEGEPATESFAETRTVQALRPVELEPWRQVPVPGTRLRLDFVVPYRRRHRPVLLLPTDGVVLEVDGRGYHERQYEEDYERRITLAALGFRAIHVTARQVERDPARIARLVLTAVQAGPR